MWTALRSLFDPAPRTTVDVMDPREPDVPRTPPAQWKASNNLLEFRSPSMGIARTPLPLRARPESMAMRRSVSSLNFELEVDENVDPAPAELAMVPVKSAAVEPLTERVPSVQDQMASIRADFEAKKQRQRNQQQQQQQQRPFPATPESAAKSFLSSPALWRTLAQSSPAFVKTPESAVGDALLRNWDESPAFRRGALFRADSANAA